MAERPNIAAMAAAAAMARTAKKRQTLIAAPEEEDYEDYNNNNIIISSPSSSAMVGGGGGMNIAALAAAAARKKSLRKNNTTSGDSSGNSVPDIKVVTPSPPSSVLKPPLLKSEMNNHNRSSSSPSGSSNLISGSGSGSGSGRINIAALAAAAARKKFDASKAETESESDSQSTMDSPPISPNSNNSSSGGRGGPAVNNGGGGSSMNIAAMAAAAARNKQHRSSSTNYRRPISPSSPGRVTPPTQQLNGTSSPARRLSNSPAKGSSPSSKSTSNISRGGILSSSTTSLQIIEKEEEEISPPIISGGGIAAMAAAAAQKKRAKQQKIESSKSTSSGDDHQQQQQQPDPKVALMNMLNKRNNIPPSMITSSEDDRPNKETKEEKDKPDVVDPREALMSMLNKRNNIPPIIKDKPKQDEDEEEEKPPPDPRSALMAMLNKRGAPSPPAATVEEDDKPKSKIIKEEEEKPATDPRAALMSMLNKRNPPPIISEDTPKEEMEEKPAEEEEEKPVDPRAALMSMLNKRAAPPIVSEDVPNKKEPSPGGIAAMAAAAARKKEQSSSIQPASSAAVSEGDDEPVVDPRAALMSMLNKRAPPPPPEENDDGESSSTDGNEIETRPISPPSGGPINIASMAAAAAQKKKTTVLRAPSPPSTPRRKNSSSSSKKKSKSSKRRNNESLKSFSFNDQNGLEKLVSQQMDKSSPYSSSSPPSASSNNRPGMTSYQGLRQLLPDNIPNVDGPVDMDDYVDYGWKQRERRSHERRKDLAGSLSSIDESEAASIQAERQYNISEPRNLEGEEDATHAKAAEALLRVIEAKQLDLDSVISKLRSTKHNKRKALHQAGYGTGSLAGLKKIERGVSVSYMHNPIDMDDFSADDTSSINSDYSNLSTISANHRRIAKNTQKLASHIMNTPQDKFTAKQRSHLPLKDDPEYSLYFRMLRYGFTMGAVRAALQRDGKPDITRLDPDKPVYLQRVPKVAATLTPHHTTTTPEEVLNESHSSFQSNGSWKKKQSIEVSGLEFGDNGLTDKGWESALETARKKSGGGAMMNTTINTPNNTGVKTPAYRKSASGGSGRGNSNNSSSVLSKSQPKQTAPAAVSTVPPWLQSNVERGICEGWLRKRTRRGRWVRRWYLLDSTGIYYSHSPPTASSALFSKKVVKLVDARLLGAKKVRENPIEFEVWHPSKNQAIVSLRANSVVEMQQWVDAINSTSERQHIMDEVVVGSVIPQNLVKNTVDMIEQNNAMHNNGYTNANYRPASPSSASVRSGGSRYSQHNLSGSKKKLDTLLGDIDSDGEDEDSSSEEGSIISRNAMEKFKKLLSEGSLPSDVNATELSDKPKRPKLERQNSWPPLSLMSDGTHGTGESETKSKEEVEADLKRIEDDIKRLNAIEEEGPSNPTEISTSGGGGGGGGKGGTGNGDGADGDKKEGEGSTDANNKDVDGSEPKLKDDPKYDKYFKMMKMGLPKEVAQHAMTRDQMDPSILDLDPEKSLKSQLTPEGGEGGGDDGPPLKDDPKYVKYYKMMKMGLPKEAVQHAMTRDQLDPSILDLDPEKSLKSQTEPKADAADTGPPLKEDPQYIKYFKMMKMGLPKEAAKHAMVRDGLDPNILDMDPEKSLKSQTEPTEEDTGPPLKDDPKYVKYFKMMKMGLPKEAAKHAMVRDGLDPAVLDMDPEKSLKGQTESEDTGPPLKDDPKYSKYFKMLKMGLPMGAVKNALTRDGLDPAIMDLDHDKSVTSQLDPKKKDGTKGPAKKKGPKIRRKKVFWNQLDAQEGTVWSALKKLDVKLKHDQKEFEELFAQAIDAQKKKDKEATSESAKKSKSARTVKVIDAKRGMNGDIILRKVKLAPIEVATLVDNMDCGPLDPTELKALYEFMPTDEEIQGLTTYLKGQKSREEAIAEMTPCEEYMIAMIDLKESEKKFQCIIFMAELQSKLSDIKYEVDNLIAACSELKTSKRWETLLKMILVLVNKINIGDEETSSGKKADGFTLESLSKLSETKAFDNKTTVLHYLVKVIRSTNIDILKFQEEIKSVVLAKGVVMERLLTSAKQLCEDSRIVTETATKDGEEYRAHLNNPNSTLVDENGQNTGEKYRMREVKAQRASVKELRQMCTFLPEKDVPIGKADTTHFERFALFSKLELQQALSEIKEANQMYIGVLEYFGEDMKTQATDFFGMIDTFMETFDQVADLVEKEEEAKMKEARRALAKAAKLKVKAEPRSADDADMIANALKADDEDGAPINKTTSWKDRPVLVKETPNAAELTKSTANEKPAEGFNEFLKFIKKDDKAGNDATHSPSLESGEMIEEDEMPPDPRAALMSMLNKRAPPLTSEDRLKESSSEDEEEKPADPRAALMSMLNKRAAPPAEDEPNVKIEEEKPAADPRAALMSMLNKRAPPIISEDIPKKSPSEEEEKKPADARAALMSMLNNRAATPIVSDDGKPKKTEPAPEGIAAMAAAAARKKDQSSSVKPASEEKPVDPRVALMSMLNKRAPPPEDEHQRESSTAKKNEQKNESSVGKIQASMAPPPGRSALLAAVANSSRKVEGQNQSSMNETDSKPSAEPQTTRKSRLLAAVAKASTRTIEVGPNQSTVKESPRPQNPPARKSRLLAAVANASTRKSVNQSQTSLKDSSPEPSELGRLPQSSGPSNIAAMAAETARKKEERLEEERLENERVAAEAKRLENERREAQRKKCEIELKLAQAEHERIKAFEEKENARRQEEEQRKNDVRAHVKNSKKSIVDKFEETKRRLAEAKAREQRELEAKQRQLLEEKDKKPEDKQTDKLERENALRARYEGEIERKELEREKAKLERSEALGEAQRVQRALAHKRIAKQFVPTRSSSVAQDRTGKVKEQIAEAEQTRKEEEAKRLVAQTERLKKKLRAEKEKAANSGKSNSTRKGQSKLLAAVKRSETTLKASDDQPLVEKNSAGKEDTNAPPKSKLLEKVKQVESVRSQRKPSRLSMAVAAAKKGQKS